MPFTGHQDRNTRLILALVFIGFFIYSLIYISNVSGVTFRKDYWRHYQYIIIPILDQGESLKLLWENKHKNVLLHIHQIISQKTNALNLRADDYLMFFVQALMTLSLVGYLLRATKVDVSSSKNRLPFFLVLISGYLIISIFMGGRARVFYEGPLVSLQNYPHAIALILIFYLNSALKHLRWPSYVIASLLTILLLLSHLSYGLIYIAAIFATCFFIALSERNWRILILALVPIITGLFYIILVSSFTDSNHAIHRAGTMMSRFIDLFTQANTVLWMFGESFTRALIGPSLTLQVQAYPVLNFLIVGISILIMIACSLLGIVGKRDYLIGTALIFFGALIGLSGLIARARPFVDVDRFAGNFEIMWIGCIINLCLFTIHLSSKKTKLSLVSIAIVFWLVCALSMSTVYAGYQLKRSKIAGYENQARALQLFMTSLPENNIKLDYDIRGNNKNYHSVLNYLQENRLNVFSDRGQKIPSIQRHMSGRNYCAAETPLIDAKMSAINAKGCGNLNVVGVNALKVELTADSHDFGALKIRFDDHRNDLRLSVSTGQQTFFIPVKNNSKINICYRDPISSAVLKLCP